MNGTLTGRLENLSPAKRILLEMKLKGKTAPPVIRDAFSIPVRPGFRHRLCFLQSGESVFFLSNLNPDTFSL